MTEPLRQQTEPWKIGDEIDAPLDVYRCKVIQEWVDYNDHMTEAAYLTVFGWASDVLFQFIGVNDQYRAGGSSFYTVETHIVYEREASIKDSLKVTTQVLDFDTKRLHFKQNDCTSITKCSIKVAGIACLPASRCFYTLIQQLLNRQLSNHQ